jgi:hypothetical protein
VGEFWLAVLDMMISILDMMVTVREAYGGSSVALEFSLEVLGMTTGESRLTGFLVLLSSSPPFPI